MLVEAAVKTEMCSQGTADSRTMEMNSSRFHVQVQARSHNLTK